jgi:hypothetical protein
MLFNGQKSVVVTCPIYKVQILVWKKRRIYSFYEVQILVWKKRHTYSFYKAQILVWKKGRIYSFFNDGSETFSVRIQTLTIKNKLINVRTA